MAEIKNEWIDLGVLEPDKRAALKAQTQQEGATHEMREDEETGSVSIRFTDEHLEKLSRERRERVAAQQKDIKASAEAAEAQAAEMKARRKKEVEEETARIRARAKEAIGEKKGSDLTPEADKRFHELLDQLAEEKDAERRAAMTAEMRKVIDEGSVARKDAK